jgi:hypothetical protein
MNWFGLLIGILTLFIIGLGFVWVIRGERYFGYLWWPYVLGTGILFVIASLFSSSNVLSAITGIFGASLIWGSTEFKDQAVRAELGWYPFHEKKIKPPFEDIIKRWKAPHL